LYLYSTVLGTELGEGELWYPGRRGGGDGPLAGLPVGVQAPVESSVDGPLLLCPPGPHRDLARGDGAQVNLLLTLPHLNKNACRFKGTRDFKYYFRFLNKIIIVVNRQ
jgi:hypothetical protein